MRENTGDEGESLPAFVSSLFREIEEKNIDLLKNSHYIVERVLENGDDESIDWCLKTCDQDSLREAVKASELISPWTGSLWALVLDISEDSVRCLLKRSTRKTKSSS